MNHPEHYQTDHGLEAIEVIEAFFPESFHLGNAFKYLARAGKKGDLVEDLEKAIWYIERFRDEQVGHTLTPMKKALAKLGAAGIEMIWFGPDSKGVEFHSFGGSIIFRLGDDGEWHNVRSGTKHDTDYIISLVKQEWGEVVAVEEDVPKPGVTYSATEVDRFRDYRFVDNDGDEWWYEHGWWFFRDDLAEDTFSAGVPYACCEPYRLKEIND